MQKTLFITGGSSGIGLAIVTLFIRRGYQVINFDRQSSDLGYWVEVDLTDEVAFTRALEQALAQFSPQVLICNAGKHLSANIENTSPHAFKSLIELNVKSAFIACQQILPAMCAQSSGRIILMGSDQSVIAKTNSFAYCTSKHALAGMAKSIAVDYADKGITCNAICPGTVDTPLYRDAINAYSKKSGIPLSEIEIAEANEQPVKRVGMADEVAALALFLAGDDAGFITGSLQMIDGGYTAR